MGKQQRKRECPARKRPTKDQSGARSAHRRVPRRTSSRSTPRGYTLNEMLIVMAIFVTLVALAWPALRKPLARHRLQSAAKVLRADMVRTRLDAISRGQALELRYQPGKGCYRVEPLAACQAAGDHGAGGPAPLRESDLSWNAESLAPGEYLATGAASALARETELACHAHDLPKDIFFAYAAPPIDPFAEQQVVDPLSTPAAIAGLPADAELLGDEAWSEPIVFYPNGRTSDAVIELIGEQNYRIRVKLRGVTGAVVLGQMQHPHADLASTPAADEALNALNPASRQDVRSPLAPIAPP